MSISKQSPTVFVVTLLTTCTLIGTSCLRARDDDSGSDSYSKTAIELLEKSFAARKQMVLLEQQIEEDVDNTIAVLESKFANAELDHEDAELKLELLTAGHELNRLLVDLQEERLDTYVPEVRKLLEVHKKLAEVSHQYFKTRRSNPVSDVEADLDGALESSFESFEDQRTLLELRIELFFAEEEGDRVLADELRREISSVER